VRTRPRATLDEGGLMVDGAPSGTGGFAPVAVVWCRQVDNEAESPGYTTIPEEFPGRRETLDAIRVIGNLTVNVADTHDYWDPDPAQPLSYYPNLFLYPAANGRYTCIGRMFLSTEDRPRLGMKTLVFSTAELVASGEFGPAVLRAHASMGGKSAPARVTAEPDAAIYQNVGEGFLFHRGTTEPVVLVAAEQWESACQVVLDLVRLLPTSLVALGAFLVFPYFLPEAKINMHEFTEQTPLALAVMRVPRGEAQGERHAKRLQNWESAPVALRDLTKSSKSRETLPLVLQYTRDHLEQKVVEVARRVDLVEGSRTRAELHDTERQGGRDRRKEMWRIGTAMETAALLLARPKGRSVAMTGEAARRANEYLQAQPSIPVVRAPEVVVSPPIPAPTSLPNPGQHPPWLQRPAEIKLPPPGPVAVPLSVSDDNSIRSAPPPLGPSPSPPAATPSPAGPVVPATSPPPSDAELEARVTRLLDQRIAEQPRAKPEAPDPAWLRSELLAAVDSRIRESSEQTARGLLGLQTDMGSRIAVVESRPVLDPGSVSAEVERKVREKIDPVLAELTEKSKQAIQSTTEAWAERLRDELRQSVNELKVGFAHGEDELRAALAAQLEVELRETKEQGTALREEIESRVRDLLKDRATELDQRRAKEVRDLEQRLGILLDGRTKDVETRLRAALAEQNEKVTAALDERVDAAERRLGVEREARVSEISEAQTQAMAGLQVRMQAYFDQKLRENQDREREKYVELLARLKGDVEQSLAKSIDSTQFDAVVRERVTQLIESARAEQQKLLAAGVADAEIRLRGEQEENVLRLERVESKIQQRETELLRVERSLRSDVDDIDRRIQVLSDRMVPLLRKTWLKVGEIEKGGAAMIEAETRVKELRREVLRELRRVEGELLEQTSELRDRLEGTIAHQGRIWLNLLKQLSAETEELSGDLLAGPRPAQRPAKAPADPAADDFLGSELGTPVAFPQFDEDPPNPIAPTAGAPTVEEREPRRRVRRS
jgi:hypothetical protein